MKVKDLMTTESLKTCSPETKLHKVAQLMDEGNCGVLPVLNKQKKVIGMITDRDLALALSRNESEVIAKMKVEEIMSDDVVSVYSDDSLADALKEMRINKIGRLAVVNTDGKFKGILSVHNLLAQMKTNSKLEIGQQKSQDESILKTIIALSERYDQKLKTKKENNKKVLEAEEVW